MLPFLSLILYLRKQLIAILMIKCFKELENNNEIYENKDRKWTNEFRELQEKNKNKSFKSVREQNSHTTNNEGLRTRLSTILQRQLERGGINSGSFKLLNLNWNITPHLIFNKTLIQIIFVMFLKLLRNIHPMMN